MVEKRLIFPVLMFTMAGVSFAFGIWQYVAAQGERVASATRTAYIMQSIQHSAIATTQKQQLYARIFSGLPKATFLGIDLSGSFASQGDDQCTSDGQRTICQALIQAQTDQATMTAICGVCAPKGGGLR